MKLSTISALLMPLALAGVALASPVAGAKEVVKRQQAKTFQVTVGSANGALAYFPSAISGANVGDTVEFTLADGASIHSITQAVDGNQPCTQAPVGLDHTFDPAIPGSLSINVTVEFATPFHAFCNVPGHCQAGMVFSANA